MPYYAQTLVARSTLSQLVGKLDVPVAKRANSPWANADRELRRRVYAVRQPHSTLRIMKRRRWPHAHTEPSAYAR